jgi:hypothetical protein
LNSGWDLDDAGVGATGADRVAVLRRRGERAVEVGLAGLEGLRELVGLRGIGVVVHEVEQLAGLLLERRILELRGDVGIGRFEPPRVIGIVDRGLVGRGDAGGREDGQRGEGTVSEAHTPRCCNVRSRGCAATVHELAAGRVALGVTGAACRGQVRCRTGGNGTRHPTCKSN